MAVIHKVALLRTEVFVTACTRKGVKTGRKAGRLVAGVVQRLKVKVSTLSVSYTVTVGRYYYKYGTCSRIVGYT